MVTRRAGLVLAAMIALAAPSAAADDQLDEAAWVAATRKLGAGDLSGARTDFEALARAAPAGRWADDALAEAAAIAERQGDLAAARALWRQVSEQYPDGTPGRRAGPRLAALETAGGRGGQWDAVAAAHGRLERAAAAAEDPTASLRELETVLDGNPEYPRWFAAALWLGESWARVGERTRAGRWLERALGAARDPAERFRAGFARADLLTEQGAFAAADAAYRRLVPPDALAVAAVVDARADLAWARTRWWLAIAARVALALCGLVAMIALRRRAGSWRAAARALWPPPIEALFLVPVALVLGLIAETGNQLAARGIQTILAGALAITWLSGAALAQARRRGRPGAVTIAIHVSLVVLATSSLCYAAVAHEQLLDLLIETWHRGHERR